MFGRTVLGLPGYANLVLEHLLGIWKVLRSIEPEVHEEFLRGPVQERLPHDFLAARHSQEFSFEEGPDDARGVGAAEKVDLGKGHGLPMGDDRENLEGRLRKALACCDAMVIAEKGVESRRSETTPTAAHLFNANSSLRSIPGRRHGFDRILDQCTRDVAIVEGFNQSRNRHRPTGSQEDRLDGGGQILPIQRSLPC